MTIVKHLAAKKPDMFSEASEDQKTELKGVSSFANMFPYLCF